MPQIEFVCPTCRRHFEREVSPRQLAAAMQAFNRGQVPHCARCERAALTDAESVVEVPGYTRRRTREVE